MARIAVLLGSQAHSGLWSLMRGLWGRRYLGEKLQVRMCGRGKGKEEEGAVRRRGHMTPAQGSGWMGTEESEAGGSGHTPR